MKMPNGIFMLPLIASWMIRMLSGPGWINHYLILVFTGGYNILRQPAYNFNLTHLNLGTNHITAKGVSNRNLIRSFINCCMLTNYQF